ncbi:FAD-dependent 5-carboxymethylaminomethyl-2-thiouridine(34) oxidoreductase MnmC [Sulfurovum sp. zt1-1]|uniref:FAD-dependent 5-carboxymethylaminomethyl-2-thiouridine(34) oxidoreductase MnmC n=1 Tax=Sulfurovum zhangzhouensis TaxID=3019067 RepID=A0ABT7QW37_9BACT|nr:FAD-dependent 5-carboxymethylaminomethyl-2-thiouridine(34) oxidoreductase MnmC [Sulfurovum zhangzhouensis]MDM5271046.1 FAD-dependent 5-carboxymethylaminomethyl-2-thiouridine(34) oxidoreductase MnmC [Sulfurovum zhangzhouensis]
MSSTYDTIIIGAGIAGASSAYFLSRKGHKVLVLDKNGIASGGSGAAGAFVSPKIGKGGPLQSLTNEAFVFAKDFYLSYFPQCYHQSGVVRIPKDEEDAKKFAEYEPYNENSYTNWDIAALKAHHINVPFESFFFDEAGACDAPETCKAMLEDIEYIQKEVIELKFEDGIWKVDEFQAKAIVLATGYKNDLFDMRYMGVKGTWGTRGDFRSQLPMEVSMHQSMSVSANMNGIIRLGATHEKSVKEPKPCEDEQALSLKVKASSMVDTSDMELVKTFCGMRAGSKDYFPLVGKVIDVPAMLETYPAIVRGAKPELKYIDNLYICNGLGGRGFVFGPLMGKMLAECIDDKKNLDDRVNPDRLFLKWCRKSPELDHLR